MLFARDPRPDRPAAAVSFLVICPGEELGAGLTPFAGLIRSLSASA